jgi:hypothetical protein
MKICLYVLAFAMIGCTTVPQSTVTVADGEDYSIPDWVTVEEYSGYGSGDYEQERISLKNWGVGWKQLEPERGKYNWELVEEELRKARDGNYKILMRLTSITDGAVWTKAGIKVSSVVPDWVKTELKAPRDSLGSHVAFNLYVVAGWHPEVAKAFNTLIREFGKQGYPQRDELAGVYIHGLSRSRGEEHFLDEENGTRIEKTMGFTPQALERWIAGRFDAFSEAFKGVEHKIAWVGHKGGFEFGNHAGICEQQLHDAWERGFGSRGGGVEWYWRQRDNYSFGVHSDDRGYMIVDESNPNHSKARYFGEENEEYGEHWEWRWGPFAQHPYRYRITMMSCMAIRFRFIWTSSHAENMNPNLSEYARYSFGKNINSTPDAWAYLAEGVLSDDGVKNARNFERWLIQRDVPGGMTQPANRVDREYWPGGSREHMYDYAARSTNIAGGSPHIYFDLDDRFETQGPIDLKVEVLDNSNCRWRIEYNGSAGAATPTPWVQNQNDSNVRTATFRIEDAQFANALEHNMDFRIVCDGPEDVAVQWVRVVRDQLP